jgi:hypothetical protein
MKTYYIQTKFAIEGDHLQIEATLNKNQMKGYRIIYSVDANTKKEALSKLYPRECTSPTNNNW